MRNYYSDPTANAAIGAFNKEWNKMQRKANRMKALYLEGKLNYEEEEKAYKQFRGIYRPLLDKALQEAVEEAEKLAQAKIA